MLATSASVAGAVALTGLIGFVGLIVPHVLRLALGPDQRLLVPVSAVGGAAFLVLADLLARLSFALFGREFPVGVITALLGGPLSSPCCTGGGGPRTFMLEVRAGCHCAGPQLSAPSGRRP